MKNKQEEIVNKFKNNGIKVSVGKKEISNESYSGILGESRKILEIKIPKE